MPRVIQAVTNRATEKGNIQVIQEFRRVTQMLAKAVGKTFKQNREMGTKTAITIHKLGKLGAGEGN